MNSPTVQITAAKDRQEAEPNPGRVLRLVLKTRDLLGEIRHIPPEPATLERLRSGYERLQVELRSCLTADLYDELRNLVPGIQSDSIEELQLALAETLGWLEGLMQGIELTQVLTDQPFSKQAAAPSTAAMSGSHRRAAR